jgi:hypothetical protein
MTTPTTDKRSTKPNPDEGYETLPEPTIVEAFWSFETGNELRGVVLEYAEPEGNQFSGHYKVRVTAPTRCKQRDAEGSKVVPEGTIVGLNDNAKLRALRAHMKRGPISIIVRVIGPRQGGRGWEIDARVRPAF